jgi:RIO-like serine/threonine protein kinase
MGSIFSFSAQTVSMAERKVRSDLEEVLDYFRRNYHFPPEELDAVAEEERVKEITGPQREDL